MEKIVKSPYFEKTLRIVVIVLLALVIFAAGMAVGFRKGDFSRRFDEHYMQVMGGPRSPMSVFPEMQDRSPMPHGAVGQVVAVNKTEMVIRNQANTEQTVTINSQTAFNKMHSQATTTDIQVGSWVTVIGSPDENGKIVARFIRVVPPPPTNATSSETAIPSKK